MAPHRRLASLLQPADLTTQVLGGMLPQRPQQAPEYVRALVLAYLASQNKSLLVRPRTDISG